MARWRRADGRLATASQRAGVVRHRRETAASPSLPSTRPMLAALSSRPAAPAPRYSTSATPHRARAPIGGVRHPAVARAAFGGTSTAALLRLLERLDVPFSACDHTGRCDALSPAAARLLGPRGDAIRRLAEWLAGELLASEARGSAPAAGIVGEAGPAWTLRAHLLPGDDPTRAVLVLFLPAPPPGARSTARRGG